MQSDQNLDLADILIHEFPSPSEYGETLLRACHWAQSGPQSLDQGADTVYAASLTLSGQDAQALPACSNRELAQSLLEGTDTPARLDAEAMLRQIREE